MQIRASGALAALTATVGLTAGAAIAGATLPIAGGRSSQAEDPVLYRCADAAYVEVDPLGLTLCDAAPTDPLRARAEADNLQVRSGALVVSVAPGGLAAREGLLPKDVIFRVAGSDVDGGGPAATYLSAVAAESDTVVNFLRAGRPYRVKLRR